MDSKNVLRLIDQVLESLEQNNSSSRVLSCNEPHTIRKALDHELPMESSEFDEVLNSFNEQILPFTNKNTSPQFAAYITGSGNTIGAIAEFIKALLNQNSLKWNCSPIASELEKLIVQWIAGFIGLTEFKSGLLTSGGSMTNFLAIHLALFEKDPLLESSGLFNKSRKLIYCSTETHSSIERGAIFSGLGNESVRRIPVNSKFQIDTKKLEDQIGSDLNNGDEPFLIVGNAGTTNTGSIDDLKSLHLIAQKYKIWFHVDGAYGIPARGLKELSGKFDGCEYANSISINPHKWMYVPFEAGCLLVKNLKLTIQSVPDYLYTEDGKSRWESSNHTIELTKEFRALKVWFVLKYYGVNRILDFIRHDIQLIEYLALQLKPISHIEIEKEHPLSILCFRYFNPNLSSEVNDSINVRILKKIESDGLVFITGTKLRGSTFLRVFFGNPERTKKDIHFMIDTITKSLVSVLNSSKVNRTSKLTFDTNEKV